ncbi:MAG: helix-turn-helix domain-containing protein [Bacteroidota bacterium]|nr:helix-turn-helix domain-containing protein [Bacteroidota bacterium]
MEHLKVTLNRNDFLSEIRGINQSLISEFQKKSKIIAQPQYATRHDVAEALHITIGTLDRLIKNKEIKAYRIGGRILFRWSEVDQALKELSEGGK